MRLGGVNSLPKPREIKGKVSINGSQGILYHIELKTGEKIHLRNYSNSVNETKAKWTIDIIHSKESVKLNRSELKFQ